MRTALRQNHPQDPQTPSLSASLNQIISHSDAFPIQMPSIYLIKPYIEAADSPFHSSVPPGLIPHPQARILRAESDSSHFHYTLLISD